MNTLQQTIDKQRAEIQAARTALGLGEYTALKGTEVLYDRTVTYTDDKGQRVTEDCVTLHVTRTVAVLWLPRFPKAQSIVRRLGTFQVKP